MRRVVELATPCVVHIESYHVEPGAYGRTREVEEAGSGVIVRSSGNSTSLPIAMWSKGLDSPISGSKWTMGEPCAPPEWTEKMLDRCGRRDVADDGLIEARLGDSDQIEIGDIVMAMEVRSG